MDSGLDYGLDNELDFGLKTNLAFPALVPKFIGFLYFGTHISV